ncbi:MAG: DUF1343 domain-containing protein [Firmicutes bacterium]|nr:DUF1343 domain-containing protein [Bacillota bacterium]
MLKKTAALVVMFFLVFMLQLSPVFCKEPVVKLGNEVLLSDYLDLVAGKRVGLVTNQTGVNSRGESIIDIFYKHPSINLVALYAPEHGLDGRAKAGAYVESYIHEKLGIPVYSLYGQTRRPTADMLKDIDLLLFDIQDIGARTYTYMSTLNYCIDAAKQYGKPILVLDRPNPLGGMVVEGPVLEDPYISFVGVDNLPMAHGMTAGELALFFNRKIGADVKVIPMKSYRRNMIFQDTGLPWVQTSPNIPGLVNCFGYMATGLGEGTGVFQADQFQWIGGKGLNAQQFAEKLSQSGLRGVDFIPEQRGEAGGVRLAITDYYSFNPARTGIYALAYAFSLGDFHVPKSGNTIVMFDKIMGTNKIGDYLERGLSPQQIEANYRPALERFKAEREKYLLAEYAPQIVVKVSGAPIEFDSPPFIDKNDRLMVPLRAIGEALGAVVHWDAGRRTVSVVRGEKKIIFTIGSAEALVNGKARAMDTVPVIKNNRTMLPLRYVGEFLGASVDWNGTWQIVHIS